MDKVLILSGETDFANTLKSGLDKMHQFEVHIASRGEDAIALFDKIKFSVFVTDISPPDMDAIDILSYMTHHRPNTPCIVMTDHGKPWFKEKMTQQSFLYHLERPFILKSIVSAIMVGLHIRDEGRHFQGMTMASILPLVEILQKTCRMEVTSSEQKKAFLYCNKGMLIDAHFKDLNGEAAAREIAKWERIAIKVTELPRRRTRMRVKTDLMDIAGACWDKSKVVFDPPDNILSLNQVVEVNKKHAVPSATAEKQFNNEIVPIQKNKDEKTISPDLEKVDTLSHEVSMDELSIDSPEKLIQKNNKPPNKDPEQFYKKGNANAQPKIGRDMYLEYFQLVQKPFQINTDPSFLWFGEKQKEALATLQYGIQENKSFLLLTGDVGVGKTTIVKALLKGLGENELAAVINNPVMDPLDFFNYVAKAFGLSDNFKTKGAFLDTFDDFLNKSYYQGKRVLLIIDECQLLSPELLSEIRLFLNFENNGNTLINVFFIGQLEFNDILLLPENKATLQRIAINYTILPLSMKETEKYVEYRLAVAGTNRKIFKANAIREIFNFSKGFPRLINIIADRALLTGYINASKQIKKGIIKECADELDITLIRKKALHKIINKKIIN